MRIERQVAVSGVIHKYELDGFVQGAQLVVEPDHYALFVRDGRVLGLLAAGQHTLTSEAVPFLRLAYDSSTRLAANIYSLTTSPVDGVPVRSSLGKIRATRGACFELEMRALATIQVEDPFRLGAVVASLPTGATVEDMIEGMVSPRLGGFVANLAGTGELPVGTVGGAALGALREELAAGRLSLDELGLRIVDVTALEIRPTSGAAVPLSMPPPKAPDDYGLAWRLEGVPFRDGPTGTAVTVSASGHFEGADVPPHLHDWVRQLVGEAIRQSAASYTGRVAELPSRTNEWSSWLTQLVAPAVEREAGVVGSVRVSSVELSRS